MLLTSDDCLRLYGAPEKENSLILWVIPESLAITTVPKKIYCNRSLISPLSVAFRLIKERELEALLKTWDGCFNIRQKRGAGTPSLHSWGMAIDINAAWNPFGKNPTMPKDLVQCFIDAGFDWGGVWRKPDGMHFQLTREKVIK